MIKLLETPEETTTKMRCLTEVGCQSEDKCNCHIHLTSIMITTCFCTNREHYRLYFPIFSINFVAFVCILYQVIIACCAEMFVWL